VVGAYIRDSFSKDLDAHRLFSDVVERRWTWWGIRAFSASNDASHPQ
jgi:hypothetical protein